MEKYKIQHKPTYDPEAVQYMRDELTTVGFKELHTLDQVDNAILKQEDKSVLLVVNSVCGCAAGSARPGVAFALQNNIIPDYLVTVFAGMEKMTVEYVRQRFLTNFTPSSPCFALFRNGELEFAMERKDIVKREPEEIAEILMKLFNEKCSRKGPSIPLEEYEQLDHVVQCSTNLPRFKE